MKEEVIVESIGLDLVCIYSFCGEAMTGEVIEVLPRVEAYYKYNVRGEIINGESQMFLSSSYNEHDAIISSEWNIDDDE